jgi:hypothetical protein
MGGMTNRQLPLVERLIVEHYPRLAGLVQESRARRPAILDEQWPAIVSYLDGHAKPLQSFVKKHVGGPPRPLVFSALEARNIGDLDEIETWEFIEYHRTQLERRNEGQDVLNRAPSIRQGIRKYESVSLALDSLSVRGQSHEQVLRDMIPGVAYVEQANPWPSSKSKLPGRIANQIRREGIEQCHDPGKVFAPGPELLSELLSRHADALELAAFADRELLARRIQNARLSSQELESLWYGNLLGDREAGAFLERSANQVAQEKLRAIKKIYRSA